MRSLIFKLKKSAKLFQGGLGGMNGGQQPAPALQPHPLPAQLAQSQLGMPFFHLDVNIGHDIIDSQHVKGSSCNFAYIYYRSTVLVSSCERRANR